MLRCWDEHLEPLWTLHLFGVRDVVAVLCETSVGVLLDFHNSCLSRVSWRGIERGRKVRSLLAPVVRAPPL